MEGYKESECNKYVCHICDKTFMIHLDRVMQMEEKDQLITCEFCQSEFVELTEEGKIKHNEVDSQGNSFHSCFSSNGQYPDQ